MKPDPNKSLSTYICNPKHLKYATKCMNFLKEFADLKVWEARCHGERPYPYTCWYMIHSQIDEEKPCVILNFEIHSSNLYVEFRFLPYVSQNMLTKWAWRIRDRWIYIRYNDYAEGRLRQIVSTYLKNFQADLTKGNRKHKYRVFEKVESDSQIHKQYALEPNLLKINREDLKRLRKIKQLFYPKTRIPAKDNWRRLTNNEIWFEIVAQVVVVGRSDPLDRLKRNTELKDEIAYDKLRQIKDEQELKTKINHVLLQVGTRYASSNISKCRKTEALAYNLKALKRFEGGPREFLQKISRMEDYNHKVMFTMDALKYVKNKGARDLLMELGVVRNALALDTRVQNVLQKVGIEMPKDLAGKTTLYDQIEDQILEEICKPLGISGVEFDRMLYQNYSSIIKMRF